MPASRSSPSAGTRVTSVLDPGLSADARSPSHLHSDGGAPHEPVLSPSSGFGAPAGGPAFAASPQFQVFDRLRRYVRHLVSGELLSVLDLYDRLADRFVHVDASTEHLIVSNTPPAGPTAAPDREDVAAQIAFADVVDVVPNDDLITVTARDGRSLRIQCTDKTRWHVWYHGLAFLSGEQEWIRSIQAALPKSPSPRKSTAGAHGTDMQSSFTSHFSGGAAALGAAPGSYSTGSTVPAALSLSQASPSLTTASVSNGAVSPPAKSPQRRPRSDDETPFLRREVERLRHKLEQREEMIFELRRIIDMLLKDTSFEGAACEFG